ATAGGRSRNAPGPSARTPIASHSPSPVLSRPPSPMSLVSVSSSSIITIAHDGPRRSAPVAIVRTRRPTWIDWTNLVFASLLFLIALLTVIPAPVYAAWLVALAAAEGGHWLALVALLTIAPGWRRSAASRIAVLLGVASALIFIAPLIQALRVSAELPSDLARIWGESPAFSSAGLPTRERPV